MDYWYMVCLFRLFFYYCFLLTKYYYVVSSFLPPLALYNDDTMTWNDKMTTKNIWYHLYVFLYIIYYFLLMERERCRKKRKTRMRTGRYVSFEFLFIYIVLPQYQQPHAFHENRSFSTAAPFFGGTACFSGNEHDNGQRRTNDGWGKFFL